MSRSGFRARAANGPPVAAARRSSGPVERPPESATDARKPNPYTVARAPVAANATSSSNLPASEGRPAEKTATTLRPGSGRRVSKTARRARRLLLRAAAGAGAADGSVRTGASGFSPDIPSEGLADTGWGGARASESSAATRCPTTWDSATRVSARSFESETRMSEESGSRRTATRSSRPSRSRKSPTACTAAGSSPRAMDASSITTNTLRSPSAPNLSPSLATSWRVAASLMAPGPRLTRRTQRTGRAVPSTVTVKSLARRPSTKRPSRSTATTSRTAGAV